MTARCATLSIRSGCLSCVRSSPKDAEVSINAASLLFGFEKQEKQQQKAVEATLCYHKLSVRFMVTASVNVIHFTRCRCGLLWNVADSARPSLAF